MNQAYAGIRQTIAAVRNSKLSAVAISARAYGYFREITDVLSNYRIGELSLKRKVQ